MDSRLPVTVVLLSGTDTLKGIDPLLKRAGIRLVRIPLLTHLPVDPRAWFPRLEGASRPDAVILTSRAAVSMGFEPWYKTLGNHRGAVEFWAVGPETARGLREARARPVRRPGRIGARGIVRAFRRRPPQEILYFRSDRAGPGLARELRILGHRVRDLIVYKVREVPKLDSRARRDLRRARVLIATSPSALSGLRHGLDAPTFLQLRRRVRLVVLGERSRNAARGHGFREISVLRPTSAQGFTRHLLRELRDAST